MNTNRRRTAARRPTHRRGWPVGARAKLVARDALMNQMERKGFSSRRLAKYAEVTHGTIDNLLRGRTQAVNKRRTAELICEALEVPFDIFFVPEVSNTAGQSVSPRRTAA